MNYLSPFIGLIVGLAGIVFGQNGKLQKLTWLSWVLLILSFASFLITGASIYIDKRDAEAKSIELADEKAKSESLRGLVMASAFTEKSSLADGSLIVTMDYAESETSGRSDTDQADSSGSRTYMFPFFGEKVEETSIKYNVLDTIEFDYSLKNDKENKWIATAKFYDFGDKLCVLKEVDGEQEFQAESDEQCRDSRDYLYNLALGFTPTMELAFKLPQQMRFWSAFSRIDQAQRLDPDSIGSVEFKFRSAADAAKALSQIETIDIVVKFFEPVESETKPVAKTADPEALEEPVLTDSNDGIVDVVPGKSSLDQMRKEAESYREAMKKDFIKQWKAGLIKDDCLKSLQVEYSHSIARKGRSVVVKIGPIKNYNFNFCEINPI